MTVYSGDAPPDDAAAPIDFDVIVVGGGAAGLYTALCLPENLSVGLITKDNLTLSASDWAQGGIAAAIAPEDSPELHFQDTLRAGAGLCEPEAVAFLVQEAADCIDRLVQMGVAFDRQPTGNLALTLEAAHSRHRVLHAADTTGHALITTLALQVMQRPNIQVLSELFVLSLWITLAEAGQSLCRGVAVADADGVYWLRSQAVVLATGGGGQVYAQTTNPLASTGDGVVIAWRAGAEVRDLEFFQFHPTALMKPGAPHFLISEAVRGEGAHLVDDAGRRFVFDYHPKGELAPRDVVSRAIFDHLRQGNGAESVGLDLRPIAPDTIQHRFPNIIQVCQRWGVDVIQDQIPVAPAAHYWMGGVTTNIHSQTQILGLYALGETASTGIHGANRLASNSLLECIVFGKTLSALGLQPQAHPSETPSRPWAAADLQNAALAAAADYIAQIRQELPQLMWLSAGICRNHETLAAAIATVENLRSKFNALAVSQFIDQIQPGEQWRFSKTVNLRQWGESRNLLDVSCLILQSALFRTESRGGHYRDDFPETISEWRVHTLIRGKEIFKSPSIENDKKSFA